jgi:site-specific DNA-methyltransferase (adenine-specific)
MAVRIEDAGFEIRDQIMWIYGSGFPKSHNIGKAVDKIEGNEREVVGERKVLDMTGGNYKNTFDKTDKQFDITKGTSDWEGWGTALKPAHEPIVMARKPIVGTVANNVLEYGVGGINIDGCRIGNEPIKVAGHPYESFNRETKDEEGQLRNLENNKDEYREGRFPANIILDEEAGRILDEQSGERGNGWKKNYGVTDYNGKQYDSSTQQCVFGGGFTGKNTYADSGGASRFFYCPKASKKDRNEGCDALEEKMSAHSVADKCGKCGKFLGASANVCKCEEPERVGISSKNNHPTVKPTDLMGYLIRLVTPKGGVVLDPFTGSGSTGKAAVREGMQFIGIEREEEYFEIAKQRIEWEVSKKPNNKFWD